MTKEQLQEQMIDLDTSDEEGFFRANQITFNVVEEDKKPKNPLGDGSQPNRANVHVRNGFISRFVSWG